MNDPAGLPRYADTVVVGGGSAGAAVAAILAEHSTESVLLLEAGPDYGPFAEGSWPTDLTDARMLPVSHDWGYRSEEGRGFACDRGRVLGGCSSINGCVATWGSRADYEVWASAGQSAEWSTDALLPLFRTASERLRVRRFAAEEITPFQQAFLESAPSVGIPVVDDLNDLEQDVGIAPFPANIDHGVRWNAAFAYLDPLRDRPNLTIRGGVLTDRVLFDGRRAVGVSVVTAAGVTRIDAGRVVLAAGSYGSPAILLRSGVGDPAVLARAGVRPVHPLLGVGRNLHDHPRITLTFGGTTELERLTAAFAATRWTPEEQVIAKTRSPACTSGFDLHLFPICSRPIPGFGWIWKISIGCLTPRSRGSLWLKSADPAAPPVIDHRYLAESEDSRVLTGGLDIVRNWARQPRLRFLGPELEPGPQCRSQRATSAWIRASVSHYYHPVGTCRLGTREDPFAVVSPRGQVHSVDGLHVADCSIMPVVPRANTNIPAVVVGERIARLLLAPRLVPT